MFEISDLKSKKLPELQEIANGLNVPKYKTLKKLDLVYQILDVQAANPKVVQAAISSTTPEVAEKPKPAKAPRPKKPRITAKTDKKEESVGVKPTDSAPKKPTRPNKPNPRPVVAKDAPAKTEATSS